jgi:L-ascorbate metabolism protein UlaG (beta-lactamase superfamily)
MRGRYRCGRPPVVEVQLIRNATLVVQLGGTRLLVDPMLDPAGARPAIANTEPELPNPLVELPVATDDLLAVDAVLVTHLHADHFDDTAARLIADRLPVFCQPEDVEALRERAVTRLTAVADAVAIAIGDVQVTRTGGHHGFGELGEALGPVSGYVLEAAEETLYLAGDTVWCQEVDTVLRGLTPDVVVVNAGGARFIGSERIIMDLGDVRMVRAAAPEATVIAVHLEAINHCPITRAQMRELDGVRVPEDGEVA